MRTSSVEQLILDFFEHHPAEEAHFTAQEVYQNLKPQLPAVNSSTVYRALERMSHAGKISISDMGTGAAVYEAVGRHRHHHLVCEGCKKVFTLEDEVVQPFFADLRRRSQFTITTNHLVLFGYCETCQKNQNTEE